MMPSTLPRRSREQGFTLVELMVALTIGLVLTIVVAQLFLGSRRTYATTDDVSRMQENIRYTYQLLTRTIHLAGYKSSANTRVEDVFAAGTPVLAGVEGTGIISDSFTVRYQGNSNGPGAAADGSIVDCLGQPVAAGVMAANTFSIAVGRNGANALFCSVDGVNNVEVVPDVENMQILYGVDNDSNLVVDSYVRTTDAGFNANNVRSVRVALLFRTPNPGVSPTTVTRTYDLNGPPAAGGATLGPFNDTRIRRDLTMTVNMRNRTP